MANTANVYQLQDDQEVLVQIALTDDVGNSTTLPAGATVVFATSDAAIVTVKQDTTDPTKAVISSVGGQGTTKLGTAQINVTITLAGSANPISGQLDVQVVGGSASQVQFTPGTPTPRPIS